MRIARKRRCPPLFLRLFVSGALAAVLGACGATAPGPTLDEAETFVGDAESRLLSLWIGAGRAGWVQNNFITDDTSALAAAANAQVMAATTDLAAAASRFNALDLPQPLERKLTLLKTSLSAVAPSGFRPAGRARHTHD